MLVGSFFSWWYGAGWRQVAVSFEPRLSAVAAAFSVNQLLRTLFSPWRRIITYPGASLSDKMRAWGDNLFSRMIGFVVRVFVLLAAGLAVAVIAVLTAIEVIAWPLLPLAVPGCLILGAML